MNETPIPICRILAIGHDNSGSYQIFSSLIETFPDVEFSLAITDGLYYRKSFVQSVIKLVWESSVLFCAVRFLDLLSYRVKGNTLERLAAKNKITFFRTRDINSDGSLASVRSMKPDLIVSLYSMHIFRRQLLDLATLGGITAHPSILPNYRGLEVFFWAMANDEKEIGVSVFTLGESVDYGRVLNETLLPLRADQSMADVYRMITRSAADLLARSIDDIRSGAMKFRIPEGEGSYYPMPTRTAVRAFLRKGKRFF